MCWQTPLNPKAELSQSAVMVPALMSVRFSKPKSRAKMSRYRNVSIVVAAVATTCVPLCAQTSESSASVDEILRSIKRESEVHRGDASGDAELADESHESRMSAHESPGQEVGIQEFFEAYIDSLASNNAYDTARLYADVSKSCYAKSATGMWSRAELAAEHEKFLRTFPQRSFSNITVHSATSLGPGRVRVSYSMNYQYLGKKEAAGRTDISIVVEKRNGSWQITEFDETVTRF
jgi:hypothetical protein